MAKINEKKTNTKATELEKKPNDNTTELEKKRKLSHLGGGTSKISTQHKKGKLTARERIKLLLDENTFEEFDSFVTHRTDSFGLNNKKPLGDAVITGHGKINGQNIFIFAQDFTVFGGSVSEVVGNKICKVMDLAIKNGCPIIGLNDSGGARIQEGVDSLKAYGDIFLRNTQASGVIPQISVILGPTAGGAVYSPALTDFIFMVNEIGQMYITGPDVVEAVTGEIVSHEKLGGAEIHSNHSGVAHFVAKTEKDCFQQIKQLLQYIPPNNCDDPPTFASQDTPERLTNNLAKIIPTEANKPYNVKKIITGIVDNEIFFEIQPQFAPNIVIGFAKLDGKSVGIVANQPEHLAGVLDINSSNKAARFVRFCDSFNIPIITFVDVPGYMPGIHQEHHGIIKDGAKLIYAYSEATVPKITVILRKAYGGAYIVMGSKHLNTDINYAWPNAEIGVMGPDAAVKILYKKLFEQKNIDTEKIKTLEQEYKEKITNPFVAANRGFIDDIIEPEMTRIKLIKSLNLLESKRQSGISKKHGNIPL